MRQRYRNHIDHQIHVVHAIHEKFRKDVKGKLPKKMIKAKKADWDAAVATAIPVIKEVLAALGTVWNELEKFHN